MLPNVELTDSSMFDISKFNGSSKVYCHFVITPSLNAV